MHLKSCSQHLGKAMLSVYRRSGMFLIEYRSGEIHTKTNPIFHMVESFGITCYKEGDTSPWEIASDDASKYRCKRILDTVS